MLELLPEGFDLMQSRAVALRQDQVAGLAVHRDYLLAFDALMLAVKRLPGPLEKLVQRRKT